MTDTLTRQEIVDLIEKESGTCVSILMRTHQSGRKTTQNPIRFKNLITKAIARVGDGDAKLRKRLEKLAKLEHDFDFWQHQSAGFAMYVSGNFDQHFKLSHCPDETVYIANHFYIVPLADSLRGSGSTRVLALSWDRARLFSCDGHEAHEICGGSFPVTKDELVTERDAEEQLQFSTHSTKGGGPSGPGTGSIAMYHGHGEGEAKIEADRDMYLTRVGRMVADEVYNTDHPLIVLATEEVGGHFTSTTDVEVKKVVHASPDGLDDQELHARIIEASRPLLKKHEEALGEKLGTAIANQTGSRDLEDIVLQAADGRVDTLFLGEVEFRRGTFDRDARQVRLDDGADTDLVNVAVRESIRAGGSIVKLFDEEAGHCVAAIYRY